ncbi:hypothetical protein FA95DRAFT_1562618 [Auriscalpium vulgare]|uniref:Uncharacterized protein n=1 Tax=Auriscalpium vulgare TaxID=40419 RepID=A0ACB8RIP1_9AGAM|nr:hypothetical protein FA95DRAFT_1562618 [Auriscalpium vulgare]
MSPPSGFSPTLPPHKRYLSLSADGKQERPDRLPKNKFFAAIIRFRRRTGHLGGLPQDLSQSHFLQQVQKHHNRERSKYYHLPPQPMFSTLDDLEALEWQHKRDLAELVLADRERKRLEE